jgi:hypothetical protein
MVARPIGAWISPPSLRAMAIGSMPNTIATAVMMIGRTRAWPACSSACEALAPALRAWFANSTRRIALFVTSPIIGNGSSVLRQTSNASITPVGASGSYAMIAIGWTKLPNRLAGTMHMKITASSIAPSIAWKASAWSRVAPRTSKL